MPASELDVARFREVMGHFATGVTIVAGLEDGAPAGFTAQSFTSLSLDPPLVIICPGKSSTSWPRIRGSGAFCVSVLGDDQEAICRTFASKAPDKFTGIGWKPAPGTGSPMLDGALAWIDCRIEAEHDGGDHTIVVGHVVDMARADAGDAPLLFYRGGFGRFHS